MFDKMQESSIITNPKQKTLFTLMREALNLAKQTKIENVFLLGQSRSGKSTTFNWISDHKLMIGSGQEMDPVYQINKKNSKETDVAQVKKGYKSVTLIPNFFPLAANLGLVDMPGTRDQRTQIHVMMVSFIYNVFLKFSEKAKFVLVITNEGFKAPDSAKMVSLVGMFIKLFKCSQMTDEQLQSLFRSVSFLVTSVPIEIGKEQLMKTYYSKLLREKLFFLKQLKQYEKIGEIFPYIQMMLTNIINNERIELFPKARFELPPQPCTLLQKFEERKWGTCQLRSLSQFLKFPYAEQFIQLTNEQQKNLKNILYQKIQDYKGIKKLLAKFIQNYLNSPINNTYQYQQYQEIYQSLEEFYLQRLLQTEEQKQRQRRFFEEFEEGDKQIDHSPVLVLQNILKMHKITFEISFQDQRHQNEKKLNQFEYFKGFYRRTFIYIIQAFALTKKAQQLLTRIKDILLQRMDHFMYISEMQAQSEGSFQFEIKEAIQIMNEFTYRDFQVIDKFCISANIQKIDQGLLGIDQSVQVIKYLNSLNFQQQESELYFQILLKFYKIAAQKSKKEQRRNLSIEFYLQILITLVKLKVVFQLQTTYNIRPQIKIAESLNKISSQLQSTLYQLSIQIIEFNNYNYSQLESIYMQSNTYFYLERIYAKMQSKSQKSPIQQLAFLEAYMNYNERQQKYSKAFEILKLLTRHSAAQKIKKQLYRKKKSQFESKLKCIAAAQRENEQIVPEAYLSWAHLAFTNILKVQKTKTNFKQLQDQISQKYRNKLKEKENNNQFTVQLPQKLTNYDIIVYSRYLVNKIKNRNTIVMLGGKSGKSTMSYWLRGKELLKQNERIDLKDRESLKSSTIWHIFSSHTQVPNIYGLNEEELLIDAPHIYQKSTEKLLIIGYFLKQILVHSRQSKFILVIKDQDIFKKQCIPLIEMLQFYIKIFKDFSKNIELIGGLNLLVNCSDGIDKIQLRQSLKKEADLFGDQQKSDIIEQKHRLSRSASPCSRAQIYSVLNYIFQKGLWSYFDINRKGLIIQELKQNAHWVFSQTKTKINELYSSFKPTLGFKEDVHNHLIATIAQKIQQAQQIIHFLIDVLQKVISFHRDGDYLKHYQSQFWMQLSDLLGNQYLQAQYSLKQNNQNMRNFKYADLQMPKIFFQPQLSLLQLFLVTKITDIYNQDCQFSSMTDLKNNAKKVCHIFMSGVGAYLSKTDILQLAWIKVWQILTQLEILENQTRFAKEGLSQIEALKQYDFGLTFSSKEQIRQQLFMTKTFHQFQWLQMFFNEFNLQQFKIQSKQLQFWFDILYQALRSIKNIIIDGRVYQINKARWEKAISDAVKKSKKIQQYFIQTCKNQRQVAIVLLGQCEICIVTSKYQFIVPSYDEYHQKELILILENKIQILTQKIAFFNPQLALQICDKMRKNRLKQKIFQNLDQKGLLSRSQFKQFYQLLLENGQKSRAFNLVESYKSKVDLQDKEYEEIKHRALNQKIQHRNSEVPIQFTLKQLEQILINCKAQLLN